MRAFVGAGAMVLILVAHAKTLSGDPGKAPEAERITYLIEQLGDDDFVRREAASAELVAIGEPALPLLQTAAMSDDLETRWRAAQIVKTAAARFLPIGTWTVEFANGVSQRCWISDDGLASVNEPRRRSVGKAIAKSGSAVITYDDDRVERWTWEGKRLMVEHWFPSERYPMATPVVGVAKPTP